MFSLNHQALVLGCGNQDYFQGDAEALLPPRLKQAMRERQDAQRAAKAADPRLALAGSIEAKAEEEEEAMAARMGAA
tara:strand:+ start:261 stop:491 length:231 start_codon:yes stop_codon:yes gene_type:complete